MSDKQWETFAGALSALMLAPIWIAIGFVQMLIWVLQRVVEFIKEGEG